MDTLAQGLGSIAEKYGIYIQPCGTNGDFTRYGIHASGCMTLDIPGSANGMVFKDRKHKGTGQGCHCIESRDIGAYDTCMNGCKCCYANKNPHKAFENHTYHDKDSPLLLGTVKPTDTVMQGAQKPFRTKNRKESQTMYTLLLMLIYLAFISLGLPDSLLGSGWPVMHNALQVPVSYMGIVSMIISGGTIISSLMSDRLTRKFGTRIVTVASVFLTAVALLLGRGNDCQSVCHELCPDAFHMEGWLQDGWSDPAWHCPAAFADASGLESQQAGKYGQCAKCGAGGGIENQRRAYPSAQFFCLLRSGGNRYGVGKHLHG